MNKVILLNKRPVGKPVLDDFKIITEGMPVPNNGEILLKTLYVSVDPYLRGRMNDVVSYVLPFQLNEPVQSGIIAQVVVSKNSMYTTGDIVYGNLDWKEYQVYSLNDLQIIHTADIYQSAYLGVLGLTGLTAYFGLTEIGMPKPGETLVISDAAGAVGSIAGQLGKIMGCRVIGITGSDQKARLLKSKFKFDEAINYKTTSDLGQEINLACPNGVDIYFDNVGGKISDMVLNNINMYARIPLCGTISSYNETSRASGPYVQPLLVSKSALMRGFIVSDFSNKYAEARKRLLNWLREGKLNYHETIIKGFDRIPYAFIELFEGKNEGKMIVKI